MVKGNREQGIKDIRLSIISTNKELESKFKELFPAVNVLAAEWGGDTRNVYFQDANSALIDIKENIIELEKQLTLLMNKLRSA